MKTRPVNRTDLTPKGKLGRNEKYKLLTLDRNIAEATGDLWLNNTPLGNKVLPHTLREEKKIRQNQQGLDVFQNLIISAYLRFFILFCAS